MKALGEWVQRLAQGLGIGKPEPTRIVMGSPFAWEEGARYEGLVRTLTSENAVTALAITPDGAHLVTGGHDGSVGLWRLDAGALERQWTGYAHPVMQVAVHPTGQMLASRGAYYGSAVKVWALPSGSPLQTLPNDVTPAFAAWQVQADTMDGYLFLNDGPEWLAWHPDGRRLTTVHRLQYGPDGAPGPNFGSSAFRIRQWEPAPDGAFATTAETIHPFYSYPPSAHIAVAPDGAHAAVGDGAITLLDLPAGTVRRKLPDAGQPLAYTPDGAMLVSVHSPATLCLWDAPGGHLSHMWTVAPEVAPPPPDDAEPQRRTTPPVRVQVAAVSPDGQRLAVLSLDYTRADSLEPGPTRAASQKQGVIGWESRRLRLYGLPDGELLHLFPRALVPPTFAFSADSQSLIVAAGTRITVWRV